MRIVILFVLSLLSVKVLSQTPSDPLPGNYSGFYNGDALSLVMYAPEGNNYSGTLNDSYQTFSVNLTRSGTTVKGTATESSHGLVFRVSGSIMDNQLQLQLDIDIQGTPVSMNLTLSKEGAIQASGSTLTSGGAQINLPANAQHPSSLIGTWKKEELYQSGYGDNYMGAGFSQSMTLLPDGQMADAGSNSYISGSNYSGQSSDSNYNVIPDVRWYTIDNQLYLIGFENGAVQTVHLGRWYVEGNNLLITGTNGEKILLQRQ